MNFEVIILFLEVYFIKITMLNKEMAKWAKSTGMGKPKIISDKVFAVKFKNGNEALILFKDYLDKTGKKKAVSFDYKFIKKA